MTDGVHINTPRLKAEMSHSKKANHRDQTSTSERSNKNTKPSLSTTAALSTMDLKEKSPLQDIPTISVSYT